MIIGDVNYLAVLAAGVAGWLVGAAYYMGLGKVWVAALGETMETLKARNAGKGGAAKAAPFVVSMVANLLMAFMLAALLAMAAPGGPGLHDGLHIALLVWVGFVLTTVTVNYLYAGRTLRLIVIDAGYWLLALLAQGAILALLG